MSNEVPTPWGKSVISLVEFFIIYNKLCKSSGESPPGESSPD